MSLKRLFGSLVRTIAFVGVFAAGSVNAALIDLELSLVIDVSGSVDTNEYNLQMDGYAGAFRDAGVQQNILNSINGIAVNVVFFASNYFVTTLDTFSILKTADDANLFAQTLDTFSRPGSGGTSINRGIDRAVELLLNNGLDATKGTVIDVSGDGYSSSVTTSASRDAALVRGFTINGLPIGNQSLIDFYRDNVIGGTNAFVEAADSFSDFQRAVIQKVRTETQVTNSIPEPGSILLMLAGLGLALRRQLIA